MRVTTDQLPFLRELAYQYKFAKKCIDKSSPSPFVRRKAIKRLILTEGNTGITLMAVADQLLTSDSGKMPPFSHSLIKILRQLFDDILELETDTAVTDDDRSINEMARNIIE